MRVTLPNTQELSDLMAHRDPASVTIYLPSSHIPREAEAVQLRLKNAVTEALAELKDAGASVSVRDGIAREFDALQTDRDFWLHQARSLALFASPAGLHAFRVANSFEKLVAVGDRFDMGALLRAITMPSGGYVLTLTEGDIHLYGIFPDELPTEIPLEDLPEDIDRVLDYDVATGRFNRHRASGATGPKIEQQRFSSLVQDAALKAMNGTTAPLILAASRALEPAYRAINTYPFLLDEGIAAHPESLTPADIDREAREILDRYHAAKLAGWRERFENQRTEGKATTQLTEVARAATAGAVDELLFDINSTAEGHIDDAGVVTEAAEPGPFTYGLTDEIAVRVLQSGGTVRAVRSGDLPASANGSPVAATLRFPL